MRCGVQGTCRVKSLCVDHPPHGVVSLSCWSMYFAFNPGTEGIKMITIPTLFPTLGITIPTLFPTLGMTRTCRERMSSAALQGIYRKKDEETPIASCFQCEACVMPISLVHPLIGIVLRFTLSDKKARRDSNSVEGYVCVGPPACG